MGKPSTIPDSRYNGAPELPDDRPPTRQEVWDHYRYIFAGYKDEDELRLFARNQWAWFYVRWVNTRGWDKQPDWKPGDPVNRRQVPRSPIEAGKGEGFYYRYLIDLIK